MPPLNEPLEPASRRLHPGAAAAEPGASGRPAKVRAAGWIATALAAALLWGAGPATAASPPRPAAPGSGTGPEAPPPNSMLNAQLFYQLLIGEMQIAEGDPRAAYELILDAARRSPDEALYRRAMEIALQSRAGDQALAAIRAWRTAFPRSVEAHRNLAQILIALNRPAEAVEPLRTLIQLTPAAQQSALIALVPRFFGNPSDPKATAALIDQAVQPSLDSAATRVAARVAMARGWLAAGDRARALQLARQAQGQDLRAEGPALVAVDLMDEEPQAEALVRKHLAARPQSLAVQLAYARALAIAQRPVDAIAQLEAVTQQQPALAAPWLTLGALHLELRHPLEATAALKRYLEAQEGPDADTPRPIAPAAPGQGRAPAAAPEPAALPPSDDDTPLAQLQSQARAESRAEGRTTAYLLLAQAAEQEGRLQDAQNWLEKIDSTTSALEVTVRRASLLARQGQLDAARELIRRSPEREASDRRAKLVAEAQLLRELRLWPAAMEVLQAADRAFPDDPDLLYDQSLVAEKLGDMPRMEALLRRVMGLKPDNPHAYNALGYSLADRGERLEEARALILKALTLTPGDPFITDSLGWVEFRLGNRGEALRLLRLAYAARPDVEIGAHLGEVLWVDGQQDEARRIWRESRRRDAENTVLRETLQRLKVDL